MYRGKLCYFLVFCWVLSGRSLWAAEGKEYLEYKNYHASVDLIYESAVRLEKHAQQDDHKGPHLQTKIGRMNTLVAKYCSESYESQFYLQAQTAARKIKLEYSRTQKLRTLERQRKSLYKTCHKHKIVNRKLSLSFRKKGRAQKAQSVIDEHQSIWRNVKSAYKDMISIQQGLLSNDNTRVTKQRFVDIYADVKEFECNLAREQSIFAKAKQNLKRELAAAEKRSPSSAESIRSREAIKQLDKRHELYGRLCGEIQIKKYQVDKFIKEEFYK